MTDLIALVDRLTVALHQARRSIIYERSSNIARDLADLRVEINAVRADAGLPPSLVEPTYPDQEEV